MRLTVKTITDEFAKRGSGVRLEKGDGYFYFSGGEATDWLNRTVSVHNLSGLSLEQWIAEFERLKALNRDILRAPARQSNEAAKPTAANRKRGKR